MAHDVAGEALYSPPGRSSSSVSAGARRPRGAQTGRPGRVPAAAHLLWAAVLAALVVPAQLREVPEAHTEEDVAVCTIVKDQYEDVREWAEHYRRLGVSRVYLVDSNSSQPVAGAIEDLVEAGFVEYFYSENLRRITRFPQLFVYDVCLSLFGARHAWLLFVDVDEFLVLRGTEMGRPAPLPRLLRRYAAWGGLVINWRIFGSSGHLERPSDGTLESFTKCLPEGHPMNRHVKTAVRTGRRGPGAGPAASALTPHHFAFRPGFYPVTEAFARADGPETDEVSVAHVAVNHYAVKSAAEFRGKMARGNGMNDPKTWEYLTAIDAAATATCRPYL